MENEKMDNEGWWHNIDCADHYYLERPEPGKGFYFCVGSKIPANDHEKVFELFTTARYYSSEYNIPFAIFFDPDKNQGIKELLEQDNKSWDHNDNKVGRLYNTINLLIDKYNEREIENFTPEHLIVRHFHNETTSGIDIISKSNSKCIESVDILAKDSDLTATNYCLKYQDLVL
jgi:hypothetical protein